MLAGRAPRSGARGEASAARRGAPPRGGAARGSDSHPVARDRESDSGVSTSAFPVAAARGRESDESRRRPAQQPSARARARRPRRRDERPIRQGLEGRRSAATLPAASAVEPLLVQPSVDRVRPRCVVRVKIVPKSHEASGSPRWRQARRDGGRRRRRSPRRGRTARCSGPAAAAARASSHGTRAGRRSSASRVAPPDPPVGVVEAAAVAVDEPSAGRRRARRTASSGCGAASGQSRALARRVRFPAPVRGRGLRVAFGGTLGTRRSERMTRARGERDDGAAGGARAPGDRRARALDARVRDAPVARRRSRGSASSPR